MPLRQPLPGVWSSQVVLAQNRATNISANDFEISNNGNHFNANKTYYGLPFPFVRFYFNNQGTGTAAIKAMRAKDGVLLVQTILGAGSGAGIATDGSFYRTFTLPNDNQNGLTFSVTKTGTVSVDIVIEGLTDSGLLPEMEIETQPDIRGRHLRRIQPGIQPLGQAAPSPGTVVGR